MVVTSVIYLSIYLIIQSELWILQSALSVNGNIYFYWNYSVSLKYQRFTLPNNKECVANAQNYKIDDKALKGVTGYVR